MPESILVVAICGGAVGVGAHLSRKYFEQSKELVDRILACLLLVLLAPLLVICAVIVRTCSRGPALFKQIRLGRGGRTFCLYKFRTMRVNAEKKTGAVWAKKGDPRIVPACRWMRRSHIDELPQLLNVLKGEMSLVGPRPERPEIVQELQKHYPLINRRLEVRPGITGLAQIRNGYDTSVEGFRHKLDLDLEYIHNRNWSMDLKILAATLTKLNDESSR